jgi:hypothetical protein
MAGTHAETRFRIVILRSAATKNLVVHGSQVIPRFAQNDKARFLDGHSVL